MTHTNLAEVITRGKIPVVSGKEFVKLVSKLGYNPIHQLGSHLKLRRDIPGTSKHNIVVPLHSELGSGKFNALLTDLSVANHVPKYRLLEMLA